MLSIFLSYYFTKINSYKSSCCKLYFKSFKSLTIQKAMTYPMFTILHILLLPYVVNVGGTGAVATTGPFKSVREVTERKSNIYSRLTVTSLKF